MLISSKHVIQPLKPAFDEINIYVMIEVIDVLHGHSEILESKLKWKTCLAVEFRIFNLVTLDSHR